MGLAGTRPGEQRPTAASAGPSPASAVRFGVALAPRQLRAEPVRPRPAGSPANCGPRPSRQGHATVFPKFAQVKSDASSWNPLIEDHCSGRIHVHANGTRFGAENAYPKERTKETLVGSNGSLHEPRVWQKSDSMQRHLGECAHIGAHANGGEMSFENLILLCRICHVRIDSDNSTAHNQRAPTLEE